MKENKRNMTFIFHTEKQIYVAHMLNMTLDIKASIYIPNTTSKEFQWQSTRD